jgi:hypothetical protein
LKKTLIFSMICLLSMFSTASSQKIDGMFNVSLFGGYSIPLGNMAENGPSNFEILYRSTGYNFGIFTEYFKASELGIGLIFLYALHGSKKIDAFGKSLDLADMLHTINIGIHIKYGAISESTFRPYFMIGGGLTMNKIEDRFLEFDDNLNIIKRGEMKLDNSIYLSCGAGIMCLVFHKISIFGELDYNYYLTKNAGYEIDGIKENDNYIDTNYYLVDIKIGINFWFGGRDQ